MLSSVAENASAGVVGVVAKFSINDDESAALWGLPWLARLLYYDVIRPNMDFQTGVVGVRTDRTKRLSYQAIHEQLEVHSNQGRVKYERPSEKQVRVGFDQLVKSGLVERVLKEDGSAMFLVFRCLLADTDKSAQKKEGSNRAGSKAGLGQQTGQYQKHDTSVDKASDSNDSAKNNQTENPLNRTDQPPETGQTNHPKQGTPPEPYIQTDRQTSRAREKTSIPVPFEIDGTMSTYLYMSGISLEQAKFQLAFFVMANEKSQYASDDWRREFLDYIRRFSWRWVQYKQKKHLVPVPAVSAGADAFNGFITPETFNDDGQ